MAIRMFCTTFFTALAAWTAAPALAFAPAVAGDTVQRQPATIISLESAAFTGPAAPPIATAGNAPLEQLIRDGAPDLTGQPYGQAQPGTEPGSLPLLGAAAIALLVAQLRRSRYPMP